VAEDVAAGAASRPAADGPAPSRAERARTSAYYTRFSLAYMLLIMLAVGGVGALVLILVRPDAVRSPAWSKFKPTGSPIAMERQIATQVSSEYSASTTSKLVTVYPGVLQSTQLTQTSTGPASVEVPVTLVAVQPDFSTGQHEQGVYTFFQPDSTVAYEMCGFGDTQQNCGVTTATGGDPSRLLHREALELALYTLKYVPNTNAVVTYLPPPASPQASETAVFIARKDVQRILDRPLTRTLRPQQVLLGAGVSDGAEVNDLIRSHVYSPAFQTLPGDGTEALVLTPALAAH
jgi:hypothetical protein